MCEKNLAPLASAQSFMAAATTSAVAGSSGAPVCTVAFIALNARLGERLLHGGQVEDVAWPRSPTADAWHRRQSGTVRSVTWLMAWDLVALLLIVASRCRERMASPSVSALT